MHAQSWKERHQYFHIPIALWSSLYHYQYVCKIQCFKTKGFLSHLIYFKNNRPCSFLPWVQRSVLYPLFWFKRPTLKNIHIGKYINTSGLSPPNTVVINKMWVTVTGSCHHWYPVWKGRQIWACPRHVTCQLILSKLKTTSRWEMQLSTGHHAVVKHKDICYASHGWSSNKKQRTFISNPISWCVQPSEFTIFEWIMRIFLILWPLWRLNADSSKSLSLFPAGWQSAANFKSLYSQTSILFEHQRKTSLEENLFFSPHFSSTSPSQNIVVCSQT